MELSELSGIGTFNATAPSLSRVFMKRVFPPVCFPTAGTVGLRDRVLQPCWEPDSLPRAMAPTYPSLEGTAGMRDVLGCRVSPMQLECWGSLACSLDFVSTSLSNPPAVLFCFVLFSPRSFPNCPFVPKQFCFANAKGASLRQHRCSSVLLTGSARKSNAALPLRSSCCPLQPPLLLPWHSSGAGNITAAR